MHSHHQQSIENIVAHFKNDSEILALLLGGSIAHGLAAETADIDVMMIVPDENHRERLRTSPPPGLAFSPLSCLYQFIRRVYNRPSWGQAPGMPIGFTKGSLMINTRVDSIQRSIAFNLLIFGAMNRTRSDGSFVRHLSKAEPFHQASHSGCRRLNTGKVKDVA